MQKKQQGRNEDQYKHLWPEPKKPYKSDSNLRKAPPLIVILVLLVIVQLAFGGYGIVLQAFAKNAHADSLVFSMLRDAFCAPVLFFAAIAFERTIPWPQLREVPLLFTLGLLGMFGNQVFITPRRTLPVFFSHAFLYLLHFLPLFFAWSHYPLAKGILIGAGGAIVMILFKPGSPPSNVHVMHYDDTKCLHLNHTDTFDTKTCFAAHSKPKDFNITKPYFDLHCVKNPNSSVFAVHLSEYLDPGCHGNHTPIILPDQHTCFFRTTFRCVHSSSTSQILGIIFLLLNCSCMALYVLVQKRFIFGRSDVDKQDPSSVARWHKYPIFLTAYSYFFGAVIMAGTAAVRYAIYMDSHVFIVPTETFAGLAYAVFVSSALAYGLISFCNKYVSSLVVTSFWPLQVFVTVILSYLVFNDELVTLEYVGMTLIMFGMFAFSSVAVCEYEPIK
eukprot:gene2381-5328_t